MNKSRQTTWERELESDFASVVRQRGERYFTGGAVLDFVAGDESFSACVEGSSLYEASVEWESSASARGANLSCSCPAFSNWGPCKHLWALVLEADRQGVELPEQGDERELATRTIAAQAPARAKRAVRESEFQSDLVQQLREVIRDVRNKEERRDSRALDPARGATRARPSRSLEGLRVLEESLPPDRDPWENLGLAAFELSYVLDSEVAALEGQLRVQVHIRQRKKNGSWGVAREYTPGAYNQPAAREASDRAILAAMRGADTGLSNLYGYGRWYSSASGFPIGAELSLTLLPLLVRSGRLYCGDQARQEGRPYELDEGAEYHFRPELIEEADTRELVVVGRFERAGESLPLEQVDWVLEGGFLQHADRVARFAPLEALELIRALCIYGPLRIPLEQRATVLELLARLPGAALEDLAGVEALESPRPEPHLFIRAGAEEAHHSQHLECAISHVYAGQEVDVFDPRLQLLRVSDGRLLRRDFALESESLKTFLEHGGLRVEHFEGLPDRAVVPAGRVVALVSRLMDAGWTVDAEGRLWRRALGTSVKVKSQTDWFDLEGGIDFGDGQVASLPELLEAARKGAKTVRLGDGSTGLLPERWLESWGLLDLAGKVAGQALRFERNQGWLLDALLAERENVQVDRAFAGLRRKIANFSGLKPLREPKGFQGELREYQRDGLGWFDFLREMGLGGCLADDMGLGKTVQVLALFEARRRARKRKGGVDLPSLVVAPRSVVFNWVEEARRFAPELRVFAHCGLDRQLRREEAEAELGGLDLILTTYGTLRRDIHELREEAFDYVVLDEAQAIKNAASQSAKAARLLNARHRLALSGTPIENHLGELWSLFEFLNPGMLGASRSFQSFVGKQRGQSGEDQELRRLSQALAPFFLRRTKEEVLKDLPDKSEQIIHCELSGRERRDYDKLRDYYRRALTTREAEVGLSRMKIQVLEALLRLRQAACHPGLIDKARGAESSAKLDALLPRLEEICAEGHKALVFSQFTSLLSILRSQLDQRGLVHEYLDGRTSKRQQKVERFQTDPACPLFLISIKAGGTGLNLTAADYVFLLDPWWNPAVEAQAIDRVHRIGRTKAVMAYRLIASDTVEEKVVQLQEHKRRLADAILGQGRVGLRDLSREDLQLLLS